MSIRTIFMGTPTFAIPVLEALLQSDKANVVGVYTTPDRPRGRGRLAERTPVKQYAVDRQLPVYQHATLRSARVQGELAALQPQAIVVAAYGKFLPPEVLRMPPHGCLNLHPSLLPRYRGPSPVATAIFEGAEVTGVSLMLLDQGMDTGPIIAQREQATSVGDTTDSLTVALFRLGAELLLENLVAWSSGRLKAQLQDEARATVTRKLERADGLARWELSAEELDRQRRAYTPWPGLFTHWQGQVLKLLDTAPLPGETPLHPPLPRGETEAPPHGQVVSLGRWDVPLGVVAGSGILGLKTVQLEGRRAVASAEFLRGYAGFVGARLT